MKVKVSIIVPIYNTEVYLRQCINSLRNQTMKEIEIILIDDASTDECPQICDEFSVFDKRIRTLHIQKSGISAARNVGIQMCTGEWIMFVDSDDWLHEKAVEILYDKAVESGTEIVCATYYMVAYKKEVENKLRSDEPGEYIVEENIPFLFGTILGNPRSSINLSNVWGKLYKKSCIINNHIYFKNNIKKGEDIIFNLYVFHFTRKIYILDCPPIYYYRTKRLESTVNFLFQDEYEMACCYYAEINLYIQKFQLWNELRFYPRTKKKVSIWNFEKKDVCGCYAVVLFLLENNYQGIVKVLF